MEVTVQDIKIFFKESGSGETVLFLHGVPDSADVWDGIVDQLKTHYRCIAPDWPGFGRSGSGKSVDCSLNGHADFVNDLANSLHLAEPFNLVAHDFGGITAMAFVAKYPERVRRLVVSNAPFSPDYRWHLWAKIWRTPLLGELSLATMNRWVFTFSLKVGSRKLSKAYIHAAYRFVNKELKSMILRMYRAMPEKAWKEWNPRLLKATEKIPTLILWGQHDPYLPNWLPERYGAWKIQRYPDSGHWVPAEETQAVVTDLLTFFSDEQKKVAKTGS